MSEKPAKLSIAPDDIPEALRDISNEETSKIPKLVLALGGGFLGLGAIAATLALAFPYWERLQTTTAVPTPPEPTSTPAAEVTPQPEPSPAPAQPENILGHLSYEEAPESELTAVTRDGRIRLRKAAAAKLLEMQAAARANGIVLELVSGFRSVEQQDYLFFKIKEQRAQVTTTRAQVSAPPGFSEHHTGYAVDLGDGRVPATRLSITFENTAAFRWLERNAARYSFELSFPKDNTQGISYEPWHWRFVGDRHSLETFYKARNLEQPLTK